MSRVRILTFLKKRVMSAAANISRGADILAYFDKSCRYNKPCQYGRDAAHIKLSGFVSRFHLGTAWWRVNTFRERSSAGLRRRQSGEPAEPK